MQSQTWCCNKTISSTLRAVYQAERNLTIKGVTHYISHMGASEDPQHFFFECHYSFDCWKKLLSIFHLQWVFVNSFKDVLPILYATAQLLWVNVVKALLAKIWFKRNQRVFKDLQCLERFAPGIPCLSFS